MRDGSDPTVRAVAAEDATAVAGVLFAGLGTAAHEITGSVLPEALASLAIALLLAFVAYRLGRDTMQLLIGQAADPGLTAAAYQLLATEPTRIDTCSRP